MAASVSGVLDRGRRARRGQLRFGLKGEQGFVLVDAVRFNVPGFFDLFDMSGFFDLRRDAHAPPRKQS